LRLFLEQVNIAGGGDAFFLGGDGEEEIFGEVLGEIGVDAVDIDEADIDDGTAADGMPGLGDPGLFDEDADEHVKMGHAGLLQFDNGDEGDGLAEAPEECDAGTWRSTGGDRRRNLPRRSVWGRA
jgi:hypothetical protein